MYQWTRKRLVYIQIIPLVIFLFIYLICCSISLPFIFSLLSSFCLLSFYICFFPSYPFLSLYVHFFPFIFSCPSYLLLVPFPLTRKEWYPFYLHLLFLGEYSGLYVNLSLLPIMFGLAICTSNELSFALIGFFSALLNNILDW